FCLVTPVLCGNVDLPAKDLSSTSCIPLGIGCHFKSIATEAHAAPPARSFLAGVLEVEHTVVAFSYAPAIYIGEQFRRAVRQRSEQIFRLLRLEILLHRGLVSSSFQPGTHRMLRHQLIELFDRRVVNCATAFPPEDLFS